MRAAATRATSALSALHESRLRDILSSVADRAYPRVILGSVIKARNDIIHPRDNPSGHGVFVGLEHIESGTGRRVGSEEIDQATLTGRKARFHPGDIVYGYLRPYLNKVWLADFEGLCSVDQYVYVVDQEQADAGYVAGFMRSSLFLSQAPVASGHGQLPRIRLDEIARVELALPPLPEQRRIAAVLREQLDSTTHLRAAVEGQAAEIGRLTAALFRSAFLEGSS
jgi:Restriction endonuclease S subunits